MTIKTVSASNAAGLSTAPTTFFVRKANEFKCSIWVEREERRVNAKSMLGILSLKIGKGEAFNLIADGPDEAEAVDALENLLASGLSDEV